MKKVVIIVAEKSIYHQRLVVETEDMEKLKKILEEEVEGKASGLYKAMDILESQGIKIVDKEENDSYPWEEVVEIYDVYEVEGE